MDSDLDDENSAHLTSKKCRESDCGEGYLIDANPGFSLAGRTGSNFSPRRLFGARDFLTLQYSLIQPPVVARYPVI